MLQQAIVEQEFQQTVEALGTVYETIAQEQSAANIAADAAAVADTIDAEPIESVPLSTEIENLNKLNKKVST